MSDVVLYELHLAGGGGDHACGDCLEEAKRDHHGDVVSVAKIDDPSAYCMWCGYGQELGSPAFSMALSPGPRVATPVSLDSGDDT